MKISAELNHEILRAKSVLIKAASMAESEKVPAKQIKSLESLIARLEDWQNRK